MVLPVRTVPIAPDDTPDVRKARGAYFTPDEISSFIAEWAIASADDSVMEPSAGDAAFLVAAVNRLRKLSPDPDFIPEVDGVEIHEYSARGGRERVRDAGGQAHVRVRDFFDVVPRPTYDAVIGNPPYVRYQGWTGEARTKSREAALRAGVPLTGLASSWAAFTVHSAQFLKDGGRLGLVLPAELLSVNYAAPVRRFLFEHFATIELVLFDEQVFPEAEADVVLLLASGYRRGPTNHAMIRQARNAADLARLAAGQPWVPHDPAGKWTGSLVASEATAPLRALLASGAFTNLQAWGETTLGIVTGGNHYFALSPARVAELGLSRSELVRLSPPGSSHLRGLVLSSRMLTSLGRLGKATYLFHPGDNPSPAAMAYIEAGERTGVNEAYKCRMRKPWHRVPLVEPADLLLTCMNADTPRLTTNRARAHHLNSVHGVYLAHEHRELGLDLLPLASLNSLTLLNAEMVGRAYGGGVLKIEPREADVWAMPSPTLVAARAEALRAVRGAVGRRLQAGRLLEAVAMVDGALLVDEGRVSQSELADVRAARAEMARRREVRSQRGR
ncbi:HsdM family class I SAM-dependent methyltransferase [Sanguibacter hominis]|uniref:HsdM family class I SAM-dependent methyltransferase n=1 Tax=Sanguibacter hominis TaxID=1312739 RepID=UPI003306D799